MCQNYQTNKSANTANTLKNKTFNETKYLEGTTKQKTKSVTIKIKIIKYISIIFKVPKHFINKK